MQTTQTEAPQTEAPKKGRKKILIDGKHVGVLLDAKDVEIAKRLGNGNVSKGIRIAFAELWGRRSAASSGPTRTPGSTAETAEDAQ